MNELMNNNTVGQEPIPEVKPKEKNTPSVPEKKELTPAQMQRRKKMLVMPLFFLVFAAVMWLIFAPSKKEDSKLTGLDGFNAEIPMPKDEGIISDKRTAYEREAQQQREKDKMRSLQDFSAMFDETVDGSRGIDGQRGESTSVQLEYDKDPYHSRDEISQRSSRHTMQSSAAAYKDVNRQLEAWYDEPATEIDEQAQLELQWRVQQLEQKLEEVEARKTAEDEQVALLEKSYQMAARYMPQGSQHMQQTDAADEAATTVITTDKVDIQPISQVRPNVVSILAAPISNEDFMEEYTKERNWEFFTAAGSETVNRKNTIRACVYQTITLTSGKELQIRLLEPMRAGDILIPTNTVITGSCRIGNERMEILVTSIQYEGHIIPVELIVYDMDGQRGVFIPSSDEINAVKEVAAQLAQSAGTSITISDDAGSQLAADMGKGLIQGASQYVGKKMGVVKVTLKANYGLLLVPKTK